MVNLQRKIDETREAFKSPGGERGYRMRAQKLRDLILRVNCTFVATGKGTGGQPSSKLKSVTIEPAVGDPVTYPALHYGGPAAVPRSSAD